MISSAIKKFANQNNLTCNKGLAYGDYQGYFLTLEDGAGFKRANFGIRCSDPDVLTVLRGFLADKSFLKTYRLRGADVTETNVHLFFNDNPGTMPKLIAFLDVMVAKLRELSIPGAELCSCCGLPLQPGTAKRVLVNRNVYPMHAACMDRLHSEMAEHAETVKSEGSAIGGILGGILGGIVGCIPWAVVYYLGYIVGWMGFIIGWCAKKGYDLAHGKQTWLKAVVVTIVSVICVVLAQYAVYTFVIMGESGYSLIDSAIVTAALMLEEPEIRSIVIRDTLIGWVFAGLGIFSTIAQIRAENRENTALPIEVE